MIRKHPVIILPVAFFCFLMVHKAVSGLTFRLNEIKYGFWA